MGRQKDGIRNVLPHLPVLHVIFRSNLPMADAMGYLLSPRSWLELLPITNEQGRTIWRRLLPKRGPP